MNNKHMKKEVLSIRKALKVTSIVILILAVLISLGAIAYVKIFENLEEKKASQEPNLLGTQVYSVIQVMEDNKLSTLPVVEVNMPEKMGNYNILGEIEIPKIDVKMYVLDTTTDDSLNLSVTKFWGDGIHEAGNFSIIGHNYRGMFRDLKELVIGDTFTLTDRTGRICTYVVYDIFIVEPDDVSCIEDTLLGQREVTLITCTTGGEKRLILKAKEQK